MRNAGDQILDFLGGLHRPQRRLRTARLTICCASLWVLFTLDLMLLDAWVAVNVTGLYLLNGLIVGLFMMLAISVLRAYRRDRRDDLRLARQADEQWQLRDRPLQAAVELIRQPRSGQSDTLRQLAIGQVLEKTGGLDPRDAVDRTVY